MTILALLKVSVHFLLDMLSTLQSVSNHNHI